MREEEAVEQAGVVHYVKDSVVRVEGDALLAVVAYFQGFSPFYSAGQKSLPLLSSVCFRVGGHHVWCVAAGEEIDECAFPGAVPAHYADLLVSLEVVCEVAEITVVAIPEGDILAVDYFCAEAGASLDFGH